MHRGQERFFSRFPSVGFTSWRGFDRLDHLDRTVGQRPRLVWVLVAVGVALVLAILAVGVWQRRWAAVAGNCAFVTGMALVIWRRSRDEGRRDGSG